MRGEYPLSHAPEMLPVELPPHARRILCVRENAHENMGTTSACAENTAATAAGLDLKRNYLRMRGEYWSVTYPDGASLELPPHARRIPRRRSFRPRVGGTTSACAENTLAHARENANDRNYLRMRGEYHPTGYHQMLSGELPPHARRIREGVPDRAFEFGTTSACAENTHRPSSP